MTEPEAHCLSCGRTDELEELDWFESTGIFEEEARCPNCNHSKFDVIRREDQWK